MTAAEKRAPRVEHDRTQEPDWESLYRQYFNPPHEPSDLSGWPFADSSKDRHQPRLVISDSTDSIDPTE